MEGKIAILVFSGTGNTAAVAEVLRDELSRHKAVDLYRIEDITRGKTTFNPNDYDLVGIGFPSYGFNAPSLVSKYTKTLDGTGGKDAFLFMTCAGPCYINYIAPLGLKKILRKRGFHVVYEKVFGMPANVLIHYSDEISRQVWDAAVRKAKVMADDLLAGRISVRKDGILATVLRGTYAWAEKLMLPLLALDYKVGATCTRCMKCVGSCPKQNIRLSKDKIRFGARCAGCYRCVYGCRQKAIRGRLFNFMIFKEGYDIQRIIRDDSIRGDFINKDTKGLFKTLYKYLYE